MNRCPRPDTVAIREAARQVLRVTVAGLAVAATAQAAPPAAKLTAESVFARADTNGDGRLSRTEVARFSVFSEKFDQFDTDRDGALSPAEFDVAFSAPQ